MKLRIFNVIFLLTICQTYGYYFGMDTPDVAKAKAEHYAAHAAATRQSNPANYNPYTNHVNPIDYNPFTNQFVSTSAVTDTPEIAKAKAEHFASHAAIYQSNPSAKFTNFFPKNVVNPYSTVPSNPAVPDTPEVARAKAEHLAAKAAIYQSNPPTTTDYSIQNFKHPNTGFMDTREIEFRYTPQFQYKAFPQPAKTVHYAPRSELYQTDSPIISEPNPHQFEQQKYVQNQNSYNEQYINPAVQDTPEVAKAKAEHFAVRDALYRSLPRLVTESNNNPNIHKSSVNYHPAQVHPEYIQIQHQHQPEITHVPIVTTTVRTPEYVPYVAEHQIVPQGSFESTQILGDTLEVARAKAEHYAAHAALGNTAVGGLKDYSVTQTLGDTPEVAKAKAEHFAAQIAARYRLL